jgi:exodeoxyribonuclease VII small subunit
MKSVSKEPAFEAAITRLEEIVTLLENGGTSLDDTITLYEEGAKLAKLCSLRLEKAEQTIEKINVSKNIKEESENA